MGIVLARVDVLHAGASATHAVDIIWKGGHRERVSVGEREQRSP
jgi:hypothetical protein